MAEGPTRPLRSLEAVGHWPGEPAVAAVDLAGVPASPPVLLGTAGPLRRRYRWASVTKPAVALATLVAAEEGILSLDEPAGPPGSTVRHLLAHASGLGPDPGPPVAAPGRTRIYSNAGYAVLGELVAARSQMHFGGYLREGVLEPLGMAGTGMDPEAEGPPAAAGLAGPLVDLVRLGGELARPVLVSAETHAAATTVAFPGLAGVLPGFGRYDPCDWGLGVEIRGGKQPHWTGAANHPSTYGHFGRTGAFLWIDPVSRLLCAVLSDHPFGSWAVRAWPQLADDLLAEAASRRAGDGGGGGSGLTRGTARPGRAGPGGARPGTTEPGAAGPGGGGDGR